MNGGYQCRTIEETNGAAVPVDLRGSSATAGAESRPPPSSGRSEAVTRAYANPYADTHASFGSTHPHWCVDVGTGLLTLTTFELWEALERGQVLAWMRVWREGMECWTPVGEIAEFAWAVAGTPAPPSAPRACPEPSSVPPPPASGVTTLPSGGSPARRSSALWVPVGLGVAFVAVAAALVMTSGRPPSRPVETSEAAEIVEAVAPLPAAPVADDRPEPQATMHHGERGQRRQPRDGRRAYGR